MGYGAIILIEKRRGYCIMTRYEQSKMANEKVTIPVIELIGKFYNITINHHNKTLFVETGDSERPYLEICMVAHTPASSEKNIREMKERIEWEQWKEREREEAKRRIDEKIEKIGG